MFKDTFLDDRVESRRPWTLAVSFLAQSLAICIAALVSLLSAGDLPAGRWMAHLLVPPPLPPAAAPAQPRPTPVRAPAPRFDESAMLAPNVIPEQIAVIVDAPSPASSADRGISGVVGVPGVAPGGATSILPGLRTPVPQPPPAPKPQTAGGPQKPLRVTSGVQMARLIHRVEPAYPALARQARISGQVRLEAIIGEDGAIRELQVLSGHPLLIQSAVDAVRQWRYRPTLLNDKAVPVLTQIEVNFKLSG